MLKEERQEIILESLNKADIIRVADLTQKLEATEMTIRRDLQSLEERGLLIRIHGGARSKESAKFEELSLNEKRGINTENKMEVAKIAASLVNDHDKLCPFPFIFIVRLQFSLVLFLRFLFPIKDFLSQ